MRYENVMLGADPELFLIDDYGHPKSAIGLIGGTKDDPRFIDDLGHAVQEDNVAVEFNIPPAQEKEQFSQSVSYMLSYIGNEVAKRNLRLNIVPAAHFSKEELLHPLAMEFGCEPDYDVWAESKNPRPTPQEGMETLRSCGGHIHVSWTKPKREDRLHLVKAMDVFCGAISILYDGDRLRRSLYGRAGAFRPKSYGIEYRTLSNFWIKSKDLTGLIFDQTMKAIDFLNSGGKISDAHADLIKDCIDNSNEASLLELQKYYPV